MRLARAREYWFVDRRERVCIVHWTAGSETGNRSSIVVPLVLAAVKRQTAAKASKPPPRRATNASMLRSSSAVKKPASTLPMIASVIREKLFFGFGNQLRALLVADALAVKLVLAGALKRNECDVLFVGLDRLANLAEFPARLAFDVQNPQWSFDHFHERVLLVVFDVNSPSSGVTSTV